MKEQAGRPSRRFVINRLIIALAIGAILIGLAAGQWTITLLHARLL